MMSSHSRILANLSSKENMSPSRKRSSEEAFSSNFAENVSKRRTIDADPISNMKSKSLFSLKPSNRTNVKKQTSIKSYYREGLKSNSSNKVKVFDENKEKKKSKPKEDDAFSLMCSEEAPEKYWEMLAEERRKALEKALKENEELADEIRDKDQVITELRTEVNELKETAKHAEYLASVLEELGKDCNLSRQEDDEEYNSESEDEVFDNKDYSDSYPDSDDETASKNDEKLPEIELSEQSSPNIASSTLNTEIVETSKEEKSEQIVTSELAKQKQAESTLKVAAEPGNVEKEQDVMGHKVSSEGINSDERNNENKDFESEDEDL